MNGRPEGRRRGPGRVGRRLGALGILALIGLAGSSPAASPPPASDPVSQAYESFCDPAVRALDHDMESGIKPRMAAFTKLLEAAKAAAIGQGSDHGGRNPPSNPSPSPTVGRSPSLVVQRGALIAQQLGFQIRDVDANRDRALAELTEARKATDPTIKRMHYKSAMTSLEQAQAELHRVAESLAAPSGGPRPATEHRLHLNDNWKTFQDLKDIAREMRDNPDKVGALLKSWDQSAGQVQSVVPAGTNFFEIRGYDRGRGTAVLGDGRAVDLRPLEGAIRQVAPAAAGRPILYEVDNPASGRPVYRADPAVLKLLASPDTRAKLAKVGGVALDVTLDLLNLAGVPDFRARGPSAVIEAPVLLSLGRLQARLAPYGRGDWGALPEELRHPGHLARLDGFVLDPARQDVLILGTASDERDEWLDIDVLTIALAAVWKRGLVPAVSLDPLPRDPFGSRLYPRMIDVPADSIMAKLMIEADYEMKSVLGGLRKIEAAGFRSLPQIMTGQGECAGGASRFWIYPVPLNPASLRVSATGRSVLFETGTQVLSEDLLIQESGLVGLGRSSEVWRVAAEAMSDSFASIEASPAVQPRAVFKRAHMLIDVVTLSKLLRVLHIDYPVLDALATLPYRRLNGHDAVAPDYPTIHIEVAGPGVPPDCELIGGIQLHPRLRRQAIDIFADTVSARLERAVDEFPAGRLALSMDRLVFALPRQQARVDSEVERLLLAATRALGDEHYAEGREILARLTRLEPTEIDGWILLARADAALGRQQEARAAIARARVLEPADDAAALTELDIRWRAEPTLDLAAEDPATRRDLSLWYTVRAQGALKAGQASQARNFAARAIALWDGNADAYFIRAVVLSDAEAEEQRRDMVDAILAYRQRIERDPDASLKPRLALALAYSANQRLLRAKRWLDIPEPSTPGQAVSAVKAADLVLDETREAAKEAREAAQLDPLLAAAWATEVLARALRIGILKELGQAIDMEAISRAADEAIARFREVHSGYEARAYVRLIEGNYPAVIADAEAALHRDPHSATAFSLRAAAHAKLGQCDAARRDLAQAARLQEAAKETLGALLRDCH